MKGTYLSHKSVGACAFLISEDDFRIIIGLELRKAGVLARNLALRKSTGADGILGHVWDMLHEDERGEFAGRPGPLAAPAGPAGPQGAGAQQQQQHAQANTDTHSITDHLSCRPQRPPAGAGAEPGREGDAPPLHQAPTARALIPLRAQVRRSLASLLIALSSPNILTISACAFIIFMVHCGREVLFIRVQGWDFANFERCQSIGKDRGTTFMS
jgi:hypothetical protein